jgi:hypothetical protein
VYVDGFESLHEYRDQAANLIGTYDKKSVLSISHNVSASDLNFKERTPDIGTQMLQYCTRTYGHKQVLCDL